MRKEKALAVLLAASGLLLVGCGETSESSSSLAPSSSETPTSSSGGSSVSTPTGNYIHEETSGDLNIYFYTEESITNRNYVWMWNDAGSFGYQGSEATTTTVDSIDESFEFLAVHIKFNVDYVAYSDWNMGSRTTLNLSGISSANMPTGIIFRSADGSSQTSDLSIDPSSLVEDNGVYNIYIHEDKGVFYYPSDFPTSPLNEGVYSEANGPRVTATGDNLSSIYSSFTKEYFYLKQYHYVDGVRVDVKEIEFNEASSSVTASRITLVLDEALDISYLYEFMAYSDKDEAISSNGELIFDTFYEEEAFDTKYGTNNPLGVTFDTNSDIGTLRVFSPRAKEVEVNIYNLDLTDYETYPLAKGENDIWYITHEGLTHLAYYTLNVNLFGVVNGEVPDPYAYSSDANGVHSQVIDFSKLDPLNVPVTIDYKPYEVSIMEMHVRDFTMHESWNGSEANRGKFKGLIEEGTTYGGKATGFDYVKAMHNEGLTHVQIMPVYDFRSVDETRLNDEAYINAPYGGIYNWGYDPQQYNAIEGSYSSDPTDGLVRVNEFKEFVSAYRNAGLGVVMDVVYNHMPAEGGTSFDLVFPDYYFRNKNYSGAGADIASERSMVRRYIVDSVVHFASHYGINGFRFDLMGLLDLDTMVAVRQALDAISPNIIVYGEGWSMFDGAPYSNLMASDMTSQEYIRNMEGNFVGAFNDTYRDGMKGSVFNANEKGYVQKALEGATGATISTNTIKYGLSGTQILSGQSYSYSTEEDGLFSSIAYVECHDNMTLYDKFMVSLDNPESTLNEAITMSNDSVMAALSPAFYQIGQSFGRSKAFTDESFKVEGKWVEDPNQTGVYYSTDSYNLSDEVNALNWSLLKTNEVLETAFTKALNERVARASALGESFNRTALRENTTWDFASSARNIISYKIVMGTTSIAHVQNYSDEVITVDGHEVAPHTTLNYIA